MSEPFAIHVTLTFKAGPPEEDIKAAAMRRAEYRTIMFPEIYVSTKTDIVRINKDTVREAYLALLSFEPENAERRR